MTDTTPEARAAAAAVAIVAAGARLVTVCEELRTLSCELAQAEVEHRAALAQLGVYHCRRAPALELAADVVLHALGALCPYVRRVTEASAAKSTRDLLSMPCARRLEVDRNAAPDRASECA